MEELKGLKDIKGIVEVNTFNPLWLLLAFVILLATIALIFYIKRKFRKKRRFKLTPRERALKKINSINWDDSKDIAYTFSQEVAQFVPQDKEANYKEILKELEAYKYKKDVPKMDSNLKKRIQKFIKGIKWVI